MAPRHVRHRPVLPLDGGGAGLRGDGLPADGAGHPPRHRGRRRPAGAGRRGAGSLPLLDRPDGDPAARPAGRHRRAVLCFAKALGEFGATITFVSNIPGETQTIPAAIYNYTQVPGGGDGARFACRSSPSSSRFRRSSPRSGWRGAQGREGRFAMTGPAIAFDAGWRGRISASTSPSRPARASPRCSAPPARASPRRSACSPGSSAPTTAHHGGRDDAARHARRRRRARPQAPRRAGVPGRAALPAPVGEGQPHLWPLVHAGF